LFLSYIGAVYFLAVIVAAIPVVILSYNLEIVTGSLGQAAVQRLILHPHTAQHIKRKYTSRQHAEQISTQNTYRSKQQRKMIFWAMQSPDVKPGSSRRIRMEKGITKRYRVDTFR